MCNFVLSLIQVVKDSEFKFLDRTPTQLVKFRGADTSQNIFLSFLLRLYCVFLCLYFLEFYPNYCHFLCTTKIYSVFWLFKRVTLVLRYFQLFCQKPLKPQEKIRSKISLGFSEKLY